MNMYNLNQEYQITENDIEKIRTEFNSMVEEVGGIEDILKKDSQMKKFLIIQKVYQHYTGDDQPGRDYNEKLSVIATGLRDTNKPEINNEQIKKILTQYLSELTTQNNQTN